MFETQYRPHERFRSHVGSRIADVFSSRFDKDGKLEVYKSGETNLYAQIQSFKDSVDLDLIIERFQNGDQTALNQKAGFFHDVTELPSNLLDSYNLLNQGEQAFMALPAEIRAKYNHSFPEFLANFNPADFSDLAHGRVDVGGELDDPAEPHAAEVEKKAT